MPAPNNIFFNISSLVQTFLEKSLLLLYCYFLQNYWKIKGFPIIIVIQNRYKFHAIHDLPLGKVNKNTIFIGQKK